MDLTESLSKNPCLYHHSIKVKTVSPTTTLPQNSWEFINSGGQLESVNFSLA